MTKISAICIMCGDTFLTHRARVCGAPKCQKSRNAKNSIAYYYRNESPSRIKFDGIPEGTVGAFSELLISSDLLSKRYSVFRSVSQSCFCDLVGIKDTKVYRIECKTGHRNLATDRVVYIKTNRDLVDVYAVYLFSEKVVKYFDAKTGDEMSL